MKSFLNFDKETTAKPETNTPDHETPDKVIMVPVDNISKVKAKQFNWLLTAATAAGIFIGAPLVVMMIGGGYDM